MSRRLPAVLLRLLRAPRLAVVVVALLAFAASACSALAVAAATVNGEKISEAEVERELDVLRDDPVFGEAIRRDPDARGQRRRQILQELVFQAVIEQEAERRDVRVTRAQVDKLIADAAAAREQTVEEFLGAENLTREEARKLAERGVRRVALLEDVIDDVSVDEDTVRDVYEGQQERFVEVHVERARARSAQEAREVVTDLQSADPADRDERFEDLGFVQLTSLDVEVQGAVNQVGDEGLTDPIPRQDGSFEIYRVLERRTKPFEEVSDEIRRSITQDEREQSFERWLFGRIRAAKIVVNPKYGRFDERAEPPSIVPSDGQLTP